MSDDGWLRQIVDRPGDQEPKLLYADWLREHDEDDLAYAWEWMARRGKMPKMSAPGGVFWLREPLTNRTPHKPWHVHRFLADNFHARFLYFGSADRTPERRLLCGATCLAHNLALIRRVADLRRLRPPRFDPAGRAVARCPA